MYNATARTYMSDLKKYNNISGDAIYVFIIMQGKPESYWIY